MPSFGMLRRVILVRTDDSEESIASIIRVTRIGELGTTLALTNNRSTLQRNTTFLRKRRFLQEPHGVTSQKTAVFLITAMETSNLIWKLEFFKMIASRRNTCINLITNNYIEILSIS
jgi:hypothetical protein